MLLDTHVVLWLLDDDARLGPGSRERLSTGTAAHVSAASLWEIAIKVELGRLRVPDDLPDRIAAAGLHWLPVTAAHNWAVRDVDGLPHRDPFDRLLVAQSVVERLPLLTADRPLLASSVSGAALLDARR